jgi:preprotein translocase subunit SecA
MGLKEGEVIQHPMISRSIERAQKKVEENNYGIRKRLLEYDDVMNAQREVIYKRRRHALFGERLSLDISNMMYDVCEQLVTTHLEANDFENFKIDILRYLSLEPPFTEEDFFNLSAEELTDRLYNTVWDAYQRKSEMLAKQAFPVVKDVYENQGNRYENIVVPISDGTHVYQIMANLKKAYETHGLEIVRSFEKIAILITIDDAWREHLREMDDLKQSVQNAAYEQKDPLLIYKFESFQLFKKMVEDMNRQIVSMLVKAHIEGTDPHAMERAQTLRRLDMSRLSMNKQDAPSLTRPSELATNREQQKMQPIRVEKKIGRNDPCPCGSGKKYKNCHGKNLA